MSVDHARPHGGEPEDDGAAFAAALRAAIDASGLALDRIHRRLQERGVDVSSATLSYWQSGRSRPGRRGSLAALGELETLLQVPRGSLAALLPARTAPARRVEAPLFSTAPEIKPGMDVDQLVAAVNNHRSRQIERVSEHCEWRIGADRTLRGRSVRRIVRALVDGVDRILVIESNDDPSATVYPTIITGAHCSVGAHYLFADQRFVVELLFDHVLAKGDSLMYEVEYDYGPIYPTDTHLDFYNLTPLRQLAWELRFHPDALPTRCEEFQFRMSPREGVRFNSLQVDATNSVVLVRHDLDPMHLVVRWWWD